MIQTGLLHFLFLLMYLNGDPKAGDKCILLSGKELEQFYSDIIPDTTTYEDGISPESRTRISTDMAKWELTDLQLPSNVILPRNRVAKSFYLFSYIYTPRIADTIFKKTDRKYISCQARQTMKQTPAFPKIEGIQLVKPEVKDDGDYFSYSYPLTSIDHKYAVVKRMRPQQWIETTRGYTYNLQLLYYKQEKGKWVCIYQSGFWY